MIHTIDTGYMGREKYAAAYLLIEGDEAVFVDTNTNSAVPKLLAALAQTGVAPQAVRYIVITHVHLDHAGGTALLAKECPEATVLAHPRAVRHIVDPSKLVASAQAVYGEEAFAKLYGEVLPLDAERVRAMEDDETVMLGARALRFLHTRGHANHHVVVHDPTSESVFAGDAFGIHYPSHQGPGTFAFPSTSPTDFDAPLARAAVDRIIGCAPSQVYPTHYGEVTDLEVAASQLKRHLSWAEGVMHDAVESDLPDDGLGAYCAQRVLDYFSGMANQHGVSLDGLDTDVELNGQGLAFAAQKHRKKRAAP